MDLIGGFPMSDDKDNIFVVVDRLTKYANFMVVKKTHSTKKITEVFCKNIYKLYGIPKVIISDRGVRFEGNFWKVFCNQAGITLYMSSSYHLQTNEQI